MHLSTVTLLSLAFPPGVSPGAPSATLAESKTSADTQLVVPSEVLDLARAKRKFEREDIGLVTRAMHRRGIDTFVLRIDPASGDVILTTEKEGVAHFDVKPGSCPNPLTINGLGAAASLPGGVLGNAFDVTQVSLDSVRLQRPPPAGFLTGAQVAPILITLADVGTPFHGETPCECAALGTDGILDINVHFNKTEVIGVLELGTEPTGASIPLQVVGLGIGEDTMFAATDCVRIQRR